MRITVSISSILRLSIPHVSIPRFEDSRIDVSGIPGTAHHDELAALHDRLAMFHQAAQGRVDALREQLHTAEGFARQIEEQIARHPRQPNA